MQSASDYPLAALRTAVPAVDKPKGTSRGGVVNGRPPRRRHVALAALIIVAVGLAGFLSWFTFVSPVTVSIAPVQSNVREQVFGLGTVGARVQSNVGFKVADVLTALQADQGDRVEAGQMLAHLDARDVEAQLAVAKAGVGQARANIEKAKAEVASATASLANAKAISARRASLFDKGFPTAEDTQTAEAAP